MVGKHQTLLDPAPPLCVLPQTHLRDHLRYSNPSFLSSITAPLAMTGRPSGSAKAPAEGALASRSRRVRWAGGGEVGWGWGGRVGRGGQRRDLLHQQATFRFVDTRQETAHVSRARGLTGEASRHLEYVNRRGKTDRCGGGNVPARVND